MIYLDHAATTPLDPRVLDAMMPYFGEKFGNPSSIYTLGQEARKAVDVSRQKVADILGCTAREILFTSSGTESNNLFLFGAARYAVASGYGKHIIATRIEHDSVLKPLEQLEREGFEVSLVEVGEDGIVEVEDVMKLVRPDTIIVSVIYANNEIGTIQPIAQIAEALKKYRSKNGSHNATKNGFPLLHTDACQAAAYLDINVKSLGVDALTLNGGKIYGPKGVGVLFVREGIKIAPMIFGGGQEYRLRSGTENVAAIVGCAKALELMADRTVREKESARLLPLRDRLIDGLLSAIPDSRLNGDRTRRLPNNANLSFRGLEGESILLRLDMLNIAASSGSACTSGSLEPSHVIRALGLPEEWSHSSTRFTLGHTTTIAEIDFVIEKLPSIVSELRQMSPF